MEDGIVGIDFGPASIGHNVWSSPLASEMASAPNDYLDLLADKNNNG